MTVCFLASFLGLAMVFINPSFAGKKSDFNQIETEVEKLIFWLKKHFPTFLKNSLLGILSSIGENWKN